MASLRRSMFWVAADMGGVTVISILSVLLTARLIGPTDFGAAAVAVGLVQLVNLYVEGLLHDALIQNPQTSQDTFSQGFWVSVGLGLVLFLVAVAAWGLLRDGPSGGLAALIAGSAAALPFGGMVGVANARLRKGFDYRYVAVPSIVSKLGATVVALSLAWLGAGAWSLVLGFLAGYAIQAVTLLSYSRWRPALRVSAAALRPLWGFALPNALMHTLVGLRIQAFLSLTAVLGGLAAAGYVNVAYRLTLTPQILLTAAFTSLGLPLLARDQGDRAALVAAFRNLSKMIAVSMPAVFLGLAVCADLLVRVVLGGQWTPSVASMQVFAVGAALYLVRLPSALLLRALGHVRYSMMNSVMHLVLTLGGMLLLRPSSALVASLLWVAPLVFLAPLTVYVVWRETRLSPAEQLRGVAVPFGSALVMAALVLAAQRALAGVPDAAALLASIGVGIASYGGLLIALDGEARALVLGRVGGGRPVPPAA